MNMEKREPARQREGKWLNKREMAEKRVMDGKRGMKKEEGNVEGRG